VIAVLEWITSSYWHTFVVVALVVLFRPVRVNITHKHYDGDDE